MNKSLFFFALVIYSASVFSDELQSREEIASLSKSLFSIGDFSGLNALGSRYLESESRTSSGLWELTLFYSGLADIPNSRVPGPSYWSSLKDRANNWIGIDSSLSFAHIFYVDILISEAWMYRGNNWGSEVRKEDWVLFHETIQSARDYLLENESIKYSDPRWYEQMLVVARAQGWELEEFYELLDEALEAYPNYYEIYFRAFNYLQPRWHGSVAEIEKFADYAVSKSSATEGNGMYTRFYWYASQTEYGHSLFSESDVRWEEMKKGILDVVDMYPDQWNINNFAVFSCLAGDVEQTRELMSMIEGRPNIRVWESGNFYNQCLILSGLNQWGQSH